MGRRNHCVKRDLNSKLDFGATYSGRVSSMLRPHEKCGLCRLIDVGDFAAVVGRLMFIAVPHWLEYFSLHNGATTLFSATIAVVTLRSQFRVITCNSVLS